jgi:hypothetical protein
MVLLLWWHNMPHTTFHDEKFSNILPSNLVLEVFEIHLLLKPIIILLAKLFLDVNCMHCVFFFVC